MNMDYARLAAFLVASVFVMALATRLVIWIHGVFRRSVLRREAVRFVGRDRMFLEALAEEDDEIASRRQDLKPYLSFREFMDAAWAGTPIDDILDRCNGVVPDKDVKPVQDQGALLAQAVVLGIFKMVETLIWMSSPKKMEAFLADFDKQSEAKK